jgi:hypothetical protein
MRRRRLGIVRHVRLLVERVVQHSKQFLEGRKIVPLDSRLNHRFHPVVAWNEQRIDLKHRRAPLRAGLRLVRKSLTPLSQPFLESRSTGKQARGPRSGPRDRSN